MGGDISISKKIGEIKFTENFKYFFNDIFLKILIFFSPEILYRVAEICEADPRVFKKTIITGRKWSL
jgi:hypothetical protein